MPVAEWKVALLLGGVFLCFFQYFYFSFEDKNKFLVVHSDAIGDAHHANSGIERGDGTHRSTTRKGNTQKRNHKINVFVESWERRRYLRALRGEYLDESYLRFQPQRPRIPYDITKPPGWRSSDLYSSFDVKCGDFSSIARNNFIAKGATKIAYAAKWEDKSVVLKAPRLDNPYGLKRDKLADVFWREAVYFSVLRHPHVLTYYGGCFEDARSFSVVQGLKQWKTGIKNARYDWKMRLHMARGIASLIEFWNTGLSPWGPLLYCDFLPQQFGFAHVSMNDQYVLHTDRIVALDVEGLLPTNGTRFFGHVLCERDTDCMNKGCYKDPSLWLTNPSSSSLIWRRRRRGGHGIGGSGEEFFNSRRGRSSSSASRKLIDEVRCNFDSKMCIGMGVEYNVYALCTMLLEELFFPDPDTIKIFGKNDDNETYLESLKNNVYPPPQVLHLIDDVVEGCSHPSISHRFTIERVVRELFLIERKHGGGRTSAGALAPRE